SVRWLDALYRLARKACADDFTAEETREPPLLREYFGKHFADSLRRELAEKIAMPLEIIPAQRFSVYCCGPIALHDDTHNYPDLHFVIVVAHSGRLGVVDSTGRAARHRTGEILLLDPHGKHALVREGLIAAEHVYDQTHGPVHDPRDQFLFVSFDVAEANMNAWLHAAANVAVSLDC
ncbi:MAG: hypothetical protein ACREUQ_07555, partial [Burkholderiales bacterium]